MSLFDSEPSADVAALWDELLELAVEGGTARTLHVPPGLETFAALYAPVAAPRWSPFVIGQLGQSLDGYIATQSGASHYVTGPESLIHLHRLRALCDAVVVGWRTVAADDPQLNVRHVPGDDPLRVVVDLRGALDSRRLMFSAEQPGALRITAPGVAAMDGVESVAVPVKSGRCAPADIIALLVARGCRRILIEGGGALVSAFVAARALDRLHLAVAPLITGEGIRGLSLPPVRDLSEAIRPLSRQIEMGRDTLFDLELRDGQ